MNKYIRLENTIRELKINEENKRNNVINYFYCEFHYGDNTVLSLFDEDDLKQYKQADTIEELCDEFVTAYIDGFHQVTSFPSQVEVILGHSVYGAIWTDKGLIYVAKLKIDGSWELI